MSTIDFETEKTTSQVTDATVSTVTNLAQQGGVAIALNTGVRSTGTQRVTIATDDLVPISAASLPLPTGASTETTLAALNTKVTACNTGAIVGTVIANAGTNLNTSALSTEVTLTKLTSTYHQISIASDNITTINYTDATKTSVSTIVQSSVSVGLTATETFDNSGATTLVITRVVV